MIVRENGDHLVLVRQADHGLLSGWVAAAWGAPPWTVPEPYDSVVVGARLHDLAWTTFDETLPCRPDGRPYSFYEVSRAITTRLYSRGIDAVEALDEYAGLLASLHFTGFMTGHWSWTPVAPPDGLVGEEGEAVERFLEHEFARRGRLRDRLGVDQGGDRQLMCNYIWLQLWDRISLDICRHGFAGWSGAYPPAPFSAVKDSETVSLRIELQPGGVCRLAPYPLISSPFRASVPAVRLPLAALEDRRALRRLWRSGCSDAIDVTFTA